MYEPLETYTVDHNKMLLDAAKMLKEHCTKQNGCCFNGCVFHGDGGGCHINVDAEPEYWEV